MELKIRCAAKSDYPDLIEISRNTWDGHDYLEKVSRHWLGDGHFLVGELSGKVIACGKISMMPGKIAWLEGLRVHPEYQGRGFGKVISRNILEIALQKTAAGIYSGIEFSTYVNNVESRGMAEKQGFKVTEWFHVLYGEELEPADEPVSVTESSLAPCDMSIYPLHVPCGWKYVHRSAPDTVEWLKENARFWQVSTGARFLSSLRGFEISPLSAAKDDPKGFVHGALTLVRSEGLDESEIMVHSSHEDLLKCACDAGYGYWEEPSAPNIPVYRYLFQGEGDMG